MFRKLAMFVSAFLPMFLIMWIKEVLIIIKNVVEKPEEYTWKRLYLNPYLITEILIIFFIGFALLFLVSRNRKTSAYTIHLKTVKNRSAEYYLAYYSLFILALMEFSFTDPIDLIVLILLLTVLGIVYIKNDLFFMNPTINIFQSYIYEVEYDSNQSTISKLIVSPVKLHEEDIIDIDVSEFEFTFLRRKHEK